jgi:hypothetical protein
VSAELEALARRVRELEDREEIRETLHQYSFLLDMNRWAEVPEAVFTADGEDVHAEDTDPPMVSKGHEALRAQFGRAMPNFESTQHLLGNHVIEVDGDEATAQTYSMSAHWLDQGEGADPGRPADFILSLLYVDKLRRTEDGWRVYNRRLHAFGPGSSLAVGWLPGFLQPGVGADVYGARDGGAAG